MLITVWRTVFPDHAEPRAFEYIFVANFFLDRISTMVNVNGNMVVTRIVAKYVSPDNSDNIIN
jgi:Na+/H+-dicarboxylate symporter